MKGNFPQSKSLRRTQLELASDIVSEEQYGFVSCCAFPHGMTSVYALLLGISSVMLALASSWACYFVSVDFVFLNNEPEQIIHTGGMTMGLLSYEDITSSNNLRCVSYSDQQTKEFDGYFQAARGCALLATILLGISVLFLICLSCLSVKPSTITILSGIVLLGAFLQTMTFLIFLSSFSCEDCQFSIGAFLSILAVVVSFVNGAVICHIPEAFSQSEFDDWNKDEYLYTSRSRINDQPPNLQRTNRQLASTSSTEDDNELYIPERLTVYDKEVVLVLPDGSKQVIEPVAKQQQNSFCTTGCSIFPDVTCA